MANGHSQKLRGGRSGQLRIRDLKLHYLAWGAQDAPPLLLLHGGSAHAHWWDFVAPILAEHHYVVAPDLRGHGDSDHTSPPAYAIDDYVADLDAFAAARLPARFALAGHSLGGVVALRFTERFPDRISALAVVDSRPRTGTGRSGLVNRLSVLPHPVFASPEEAVQRFRLLPRGTTASPEVLRHMALAGIRETGDGRFTLKFDRAAFSRRTRLDLIPALGTVRCPLLLVRGRESAFLDAATHTEMGTACAHAELVTIDDAHHHVPLDRPHALAMRLLQFFGSHDVA